MGFPLVRVPVDPLNIPFQVLEPHLFALLDLLLPSTVLPTFGPYLRRGWFFRDKAEPHLRYGPMFAIVTPRGFHIQICDLESIHDMFSRRLDFVRPVENYDETKTLLWLQKRLMHHDRASRDLRPLHFHSKCRNLASSQEGSCEPFQ